MKVLLDTNICIAVMRGHERAVTRLAAVSPADCAVSVVTVYELFTGVAKCREPERERAKVVRLLAARRILSFWRRWNRRNHVTHLFLQRSKATDEAG